MGKPVIETTPLAADPEGAASTFDNGVPVTVKKPRWAIPDACDSQVVAMHWKVFHSPWAEKLGLVTEDGAGQRYFLKMRVPCDHPPFEAGSPDEGISNSIAGDDGR